MNPAPLVSDLYFVLVAVAGLWPWDALRRPLALSLAALAMAGLCAACIPRGAPPIQETACRWLEVFLLRWDGMSFTLAGLTLLLLGVSLFELVRGLRIQ